MYCKCRKCQSGNIEIDSNYDYHDIYICRKCTHTIYFRIEDCCRKPFLVVAIQHFSYDRRSLYFQCLNCFGAEKTQPLSNKQYSEQIRVEFNQWRFENWKAERKREGNEIYEGIKYSNYQNSEHYRYRQYLLSPEWKQKRKLILERDLSTCQFCRSAPAIEVHHLHYDNRYNEPLDDLRSVCLNCHRLLHNKCYGSLNP